MPITEQLIVPRVDEREWVRLQEDLAYHFVRPLKMSRWQYLDTLPNYVPQPAEYKGRFDNLALVQPPKLELPFKKILDIVGLSFNSEVLKAKDWRGDKEGFRTPTVAYATWVDDGGNNLNIAPSVVRTNLTQDARGGTSLDGVFLYVADRGVLRRHSLDLPGSEMGSDRAPSLDLWHDGPRLRFSWVDDANSGFGSVVAGRKIVTR